MNLISIDLMVSLLAGSFLLLIMILAYLSISKWLRNKERERIEEEKEKQRLPLFLHIQNGEAFDYSTVAESALSELLQEYADVLQGEAFEEKISEIAKEKLSASISKDLRSRKWSYRMNALYQIEDLKLFSLLSEVESLYRRRKISAAEEGRILKIFAAFQQDSVVEKMRNSRCRLSDFTLFSIFLILSEDQLERCGDIFHKLSPQMKYIFIDIIGHRQLFKFHSLLESLLESDEPEIRLRLHALKAISDIGLSVQQEKVAVFFHSSSWLERKMAVRVCGTLRLDVYLEEIKALLGDREYLVRKEAAQSLLKFPEGKEQLIKAASETTDPFAKDMAQEWLEKEEMNYLY